MARILNLYLLATARVDATTDPDNPVIYQQNGSFTSAQSVANPGGFRLNMDPERRYSQKAIIKVTIEGPIHAIPSILRTAVGSFFDVSLIDETGAPINANFSIEITDQNAG